MLDQLRPLIIFAKTAQLGSFRAAANALNLSPSVVSYHVTQLEKAHNVALLYRSTRRLSLTDDGKQLFQSVKKLIDNAEEALDILSQEGRVLRGKLNVTAPAVLIRSELTKKIASFCQLFPDVELNIDFTDERKNLIQDGIDVAIRVGVMDDSNLKSRKIFDVSRKLVCSAEFLSNRPTPQNPADIEGWPWVSLSMLPASRTFQHQDGRMEKTVNTPSIAVNSVAATCQFAIHGLGLASPPDFMVDGEIALGNLIHVLPDWQVSDIPVYAVWPNNVKVGSIAQRFIHSVSAPVTI